MSRDAVIRVTAMPADTNPYGDELSIYVEELKQGRSSLRLKAQAMARERDGEGERLVAEGEFTFVALDAAGKPREIGNE